MIHAITMPRWGMAMEEGTVVAWYKKEGESVAPGDEVIDVESTKATNSLEAQAPGILRRKLAQPGSILPVGSLLGVIAAADVPENEIDSFVSGFASVDTAEIRQGLPMPQRIRVGSRHINCLTQGEADSPVVLIHGFGGSIDSWSSIQPALATKHSVVAIDLPGHGGSDEALADGTIQDLASAVPPLLDALAIDAAHLVGHSLGGAVAMVMALDYPSRVRSLTLVAPLGFGPEIDGSYIDGYLAAKRRRDLRPHVERLFADPNMVSERMLEELIRMKRIGGVENALRQIADQFLAGGRQRDLGLRARFADLAMPHLVLWGSDDRIIPANHGDKLGAIVIGGAGHMPQLEKPADVASLILAHLGGVKAAA